MPYCVMRSNLPSEKLSDEFMKEMSAFLAKLLEKDEKRVIVAIHSCQRIMIAGSLDPAIIMDLDAIDRFGPEKNQKYSDEIFKFLAEKTGLGFDRIKLKFYDLPAYDVGVYSKATQ
ncbi:macrophage migration inhibitory factor homolog isoform X1 [Saccoglossus kowalevskii]|uniref:D-dopachrome decarboxylase n=1 Tax=Saccoglossus kowalevskii TaxID=10224 RepID=A0ABM0GPQ0_SACKO|nr:PREDICTED: macrophage migration inhibitory factor homolog [Saccoglossus kowalevskii]